MRILRQIFESLGFSNVRTFIASGNVIFETKTKIARYRPFSGSKIRAASEFNILFLSNAPTQKSKQKLMALKTDTNELRVDGREVYWLRRKNQANPLFRQCPSKRHWETVYYPLSKDDQEHGYENITI